MPSSELQTNTTGSVGEAEVAALVGEALTDTGTGVVVLVVGMLEGGPVGFELGRRETEGCNDWLGVKEGTGDMVGLEDCDGRIVVVPSAGCRVLMLGLAGAGKETGDDERVGSLVVVDDGDFDAEGMSA